MNLNHLVSKLHMSTKVLIHADGEDLELTPQLLAQKGMCEVLEMGIIGESMVDVGENGAAEAKAAGELERMWLHVTIGKPLGELPVPTMLSGFGCKA